MELKNYLIKNDISETLVCDVPSPKQAIETAHKRGIKNITEIIEITDNTKDKSFLELLHWSITPEQRQEITSILTK